MCRSPASWVLLGGWLERAAAVLELLASRWLIGVSLLACLSLLGCLILLGCLVLVRRLV